MNQQDNRNITMVMDFYEMTMANGYFNNRVNDTKAVFDVFYRKNPDNAGFSIFAGLEQVIESIKSIFSARSFSPSLLITDSAVISMPCRKARWSIRTSL